MRAIHNITVLLRKVFSCCWDTLVFVLVLGFRRGSATLSEDARLGLSTGARRREETCRIWLDELSF